MATLKRPYTISLDLPLRSHTDTLEYSSSVTGGFHQIYDFILPTPHRKTSSLILTPKEDGKLQWEFPPGSDIATTALDLTPVERNVYSPPATPDSDIQTPAFSRWETSADPIMLPKAEHRLNHSSRGARSLSSNNAEVLLETRYTARCEIPRKPKIQPNRHLTHNHGALTKCRPFTFPIEYSVPGSILAKVLELPPIKLIGREEGTTPVLSVELGSELRSRIPRTQQLEPSWRLLYSLDQHGASIHTMYENLKSHQGPIVLAIKDSEDAVFGAYLSEPFQPHPGFYGSGECFLWKLFNSDPVIKVYPRSGENDYYMLSDMSFISVGSSNGKFGLWLDSQLEEGVSSRCSTFENDPLTTPKFTCVELEIWGIPS